MESEKVKEIKKALEEQTQHKPINCRHSEYVEACGMYCRHYREFVADMGSKDGQTCENCNSFTVTDKVKKYAEILSLINELESENGELKQHITEVEKGIINIARERNKKEELASKFIDCYNDSLKQFAERLKEKSDFYRHGERITDMITFDDIDETLKDFIKN